MEVKNTYDFGLIVNAATRMYRRQNSLEILQALDQIFHHYTQYIDNRTLCCSIRDMLPNCIDAWQGDDIPCDQLTMFTNLREFMLTEYFQRVYVDAKQNVFCDNEMLREASSVGVIKIPNMHCDGCFESDEEFLNWVETSVKDKNPIGFSDYDSFLLQEEDLEAFNILCISAADYSAGRLTYMPKTTADFICDNINLLTDISLKKILEVIERDTSLDWHSMRLKCKQRLCDSNKEA